MNSEAFILALLVVKKVITKDEAKKLQKSLRESVTNSDLPQMLDKVGKALQTYEEISVKKIDAKELFS